MLAGRIKIRVLGSGTSAGVPTIGCRCEVCTSEDPRDQRLRPSVLLTYNGRNVLIDATPDFRTQALRAGMDRLDAILFTHEHADHILGLDDVRPFNFRQKGSIPFFASATTLETIRRCFRYIFDGKETESSIPRLEPHEIDDRPFDLFGLEFTPVPLLHGRQAIYGFRFGEAAYLTDHSEIPPESLPLLRGLDVLFLDALRFRPHPTHSTVERSVRTAEELAPRRAFFTHICHDLGHQRTEAALPPHVRLAYDGLELWVENACPPRVFHGLEEAPEFFGPCALTIGNFDGVHEGHRRIFRRVREIAGERNLRPSVLTFDPHPTKIVAPARAPKLMTGPEQRAALMAEEGIRQVLILPFDQHFAHLSPEEFVRDILVRRLDARAVLVGHNFRFGYRQAGDVRLLAELGARFGFLTEVVPAVRLRGALVSSTAVRQLVESGQVARACRQLGRPYRVEGRVVAGHGVGSRQAVPTLNLETACEVLPARGVYITRTTDLDSARSWPSVTNIGYRPTFGGDRNLSIETFLLSDLEGAPARIRVEFLRRLREERKFPTPAALKQQILSDAERAKEYFRRLAKWHNGA